MSTINKKEIEKFSNLASEWWNPNGKFAPLHKFNPVRIEYIKDELIAHFKLDRKKPEPLKDINILDIGCGGGLLSEPLKRLGANITGIDASRNNIEFLWNHIMLYEFLDIIWIPIISRNSYNFYELLEIIGIHNLYAFQEFYEFI